MEVHVLESGRHATNPFKRRVGELIATTGTPRFEPSFFQTAREATDCEHLTAFIWSDRSAARLMFAINRGSRPVARTVAERYLAHYWNHDPANQICNRSASSDYEIAVRVLSRDIDHNAYRHDCYSSVDLIDRFSIIRRHKDEIIRLNLYRSARRGRFAAADLAPVLECGDVILALLAKHDAQRLPLDQSTEADVFAERLRRIVPQLAPRERDVCVGIIQGMSSEAIALGLGISVNTVLTYRKRAYARLGISSHNELMRLVLA
jgi:LuxR family transcriptional regulator, activator of tox operons